jgi:hypothetical protein
VKFAPIFSIACRHSYYTDGVCHDLDIVATADTERLLKNHHCLLRSRSDGVLCSAELSNDGSMLIAVGPEETLTFNLILKNAGFALITDMATIAKQQSPLFTPADAEVSKGGSLQLTSSDQVLGNGVLALVEIPGKVFANPGMPTVQYSVDFVAKQALWLYYCITDLDVAGRDLQVLDLGTSGTPIVFSTKNRTDLGQTPDPDDPLAMELAGRYPDLSRLRFASDASVASRESPRSLALQLDGHHFPDILPAPSPQNLTVWPFTKQPNVVRQDALFQVVRYVSYSFSKNGV